MPPLVFVFDLTASLHGKLAKSITFTRNIECFTRNLYKIISKIVFFKNVPIRFSSLLKRAVFRALVVQKLWPSNNHRITTQSQASDFFFDLSPPSPLGEQLNRESTVFNFNNT